MSDAIVSGFAGEFSRFAAMLETQLDRCPDDLWLKTAGGYPFWQQMYHVFAVMEVYVLPEDKPSRLPYPLEVLKFAETPETPMTKADMRAFAADMKKLAEEYIAAQSTATLQEPNVKLSKRMNKDMSVLNTLVALITHTCYHVGACDSVLRDHGVKGVY